MDYERINKYTNEILKSGANECSYIEYKVCELQLDKILKIICAYATTYIKRLHKELEVIVSVDGQGKWKYRFL